MLEQSAPVRGGVGVAGFPHCCAPLRRLDDLQPPGLRKALGVPHRKVQHGGRVQRVGAAADACERGALCGDKGCRRVAAVVRGAAAAQRGRGARHGRLAEHFAWPRCHLLGVDLHAPAGNCSDLPMQGDRPRQFGRRTTHAKRGSLCRMTAGGTGAGLSDASVPRYRTPLAAHAAARDGFASPLGGSKVNLRDVCGGEGICSIVQVCTSLELDVGGAHCVCVLVLTKVASVRRRRVASCVAPSPCCTSVA